MSIDVEKEGSVSRTLPLTLGYARGVSAYKERMKAVDGKVVRTQIEHRNGLVFMRAKQRVVYTVDTTDSENN